MKVFSNLRTFEEAVPRNSQKLLFRSNKRYFHFTELVVKLKLKTLKMLHVEDINKPEEGREISKGGELVSD